MIDISQNEDYDIEILSGDFRLGESTLQEVDNILISMQGNFKSAPMIGPNLQQLLNSSVNEREVRSRVKIHLSLDKKDYEEIKSLIHFNMKKL